MALDVGYVVSSIVLTGPQRGTYKVWVPKKHGDPTSSDSYNGFGANLGNLSSADLSQVLQIAENYYPLMPLSSGGHMPFDKTTGFVAGTEKTVKFGIDYVPTIGNKGEISGLKEKNTVGGENYKFRHSQPGMFQQFVFDTTSGQTVNTHANTPSGSYPKLSLGTKVVVCDNFIIGQLPQTQNDLINQMRPSNT